MANKPTLALLIKADSVEKVELDLDNSLRDMYKVIGCSSVDVVQLTSRYDMWIDDEGMYNYEVNPLASALAASFGFDHQPYFGPALVTGMTPDGETIGLTTDQFVALVKRVASAAGIDL